MFGEFLIQEIRRTFIEEIRKKPKLFKKIFKKSKMFENLSIQEIQKKIDTKNSKNV